MNKSLARICALSAALALTLLNGAHASDVKKGQSLVAAHG